MDRLVTRLGNWPVGGVAITLIVALTLWRTNMNRLGYEHALPTIAMVLAIAAAATMLLRLPFGSWARAGIAAALLAAFTFYSSPIAETVAGPRLTPLIVGLLLVVALLVARRIPKGDAATSLNGKLNLLLVGFALFMTTSVAVQQVQLESIRPDAPSKFEPLDGRAAANSPDVWHILFDRYASETVLAERYGFDNAPFLTELRKRGFAVGEERFSNYQRTAHSVAATLNGNDLDRLAGSITGPRNDWVPIYRAISDNQAGRFFERAGYRTTFAGTWWSPTRALGAQHNINYRSLPELGRHLLDQSALGALLRWTGLPYGDGRAEQCTREKAKFDELRTLAATPGRHYVFAHFLVPHPPFVLAADGRCKPLEEARRTSRRDNYIDQLAYSNREVLRLIDSILAGPGEEVIVIHSDEGPWPEPFVGNEHALGRDPVSVDWRKVDIARLREKMGILLAIRGPSGPPRTVPGSPVQIYPAILNDNFGGRRPLPHGRHQLFESDSDLYRFHDVAAKLGSN